MRSDPIAIVGGGPAGAIVAAKIAAGGRKVILFDEKLAWEKPCGGGITHKALTEYPFLRDAQVEHNIVDSCEFISPAGRRTTMHLNKPLAIFSRRVLNGLLLDRASSAGAELVRERVIAIERQNGSFLLRMRTGTLSAAFVVIAAGARNQFRAQFCSPFAPPDLMATFGYFIPGTSRSMQIRFINGVDGYIWVFPRHDHFSAGICGRINDVPTSELRRILEDFLTAEGLGFERATPYAHVLPALRGSTLKRTRCQGESWALIGDAAGFVDPVTGEGLYYALRSGDLLAQAILASRPQSYEDAIRKDFLAELVEAAHYAESFFHGTFLGESILERMIQFAAESASFRELLCDLFAGTQGYLGLKGRCYRTLPRVLREFVGSVGGWTDPTALVRDQV